MAQFSKGITFLDGTSGHTSSELHQLIENAHILPAFITDQVAVTPTGGDQFIFVQSSSGTLKSVTHSNLVSSFPQDAAANVYSLRRLGVGALMACAGNDIRLRNAITGIRVGAGTAVDRVATPTDLLDTDLIIPPKDLSGLTVINWDLANLFYNDVTLN